MIPPPPRSTLFPYTTLFRSFNNSPSSNGSMATVVVNKHNLLSEPCYACGSTKFWQTRFNNTVCATCHPPSSESEVVDWIEIRTEDRKSTRLNSSHVAISYAV